MRPSQKAYAKRLRGKLLEALGGKCAVCGSLEKLHVDHVHGASWEKPYYHYSRDQRAMRMMREHKAGVPLQLLCIACHNVKTSEGGL